ncbi:MAG: hypothetical protein RSE38_07545 [Acinetobacter sp.]
MHQALRMVFGKRFWGAAAMMLLCFSGYAMLEWISIHNWSLDVRPSSLQQTIGGIYFGGVMLLIPLCAALPAGLIQVEEQESTFIDFCMIRGSLRKYIFQRFVAAFVSGAATIGLAFSVHAILWNILATPCDPATNSYLAIPFAETSIYYNWESVCYGLPIYLWILFWLAFCGGMWSLVSITTAIYIPDKLMTIAIPFCIYYLWHCGLPQTITGWHWFPHPADLYNDALKWNMFAISLAVYIALGTICMILYAMRLKRRYRYEA